jgi:hypothetical protein
VQIQKTKKEKKKSKSQTSYSGKGRNVFAPCLLNKYVEIPCVLFIITKIYKDPERWARPKISGPSLAYEFPMYCFLFCFCFLEVLGLELRAFTLSHSTSPIFVKDFLR